MRWREALCTILLLVVAGCDTDGVSQPVAAGLGDVEHGRTLIASHSCGACHTIPGVTGARGVVAPPLTAFARRAFIAGRVPNTPANLVRWVRNPRQIDERTAMPDVGLRDEEARDVAAYLYALL